MEFANLAYGQKVEFTGQVYHSFLSCGCLLTFQAFYASNHALVGLERIGYHHVPSRKNVLPEISFENEPRVRALIFHSKHTTISCVAGFVHSLVRLLKTAW